MTTTTTGQISLAGNSISTTYNTSIEQELMPAYNNTTTSTISMNDLSVRLLSGIYTTGTQISFSQLYNVSPVTRTYTISGTSVETLSLIHI